MAKITISRISIENLGPFRERQRFDLSVQENRPVILIKALNGSGKTTLLTALQIGLYGYKAISQTRRSEYDQLIAGLTRQDATGNACIEIDVLIEIGSDLQQVTLHREWFKRGAGHREEFKISRNNSVDHEFTDGWDEFINGILPVELVQLFLFDGEKIEALANPEKLPGLLKRATEVFLGLGGIDALTNDLKALERRVGPGKKNHSAEVEAFQDQIKLHEKQLDEVQNSVAMLIQKQGEATASLDNAQKKLEDYSVEAQRNGLNAYEQAAELKARVRLCEERAAAARLAVVAALEDPILPLAWLGPLWDSYKTQWVEDKERRNAALLSAEFADRDRRILASVEAVDPTIAEPLAALLAADLQRYRAKDGEVAVMLAGGEPSEIEPKLAGAKARLTAARSEEHDALKALEKAELAMAEIPAEEQLSVVFKQMQDRTKEVTKAEAELQAVTQELVEARLTEQLVTARLEGTVARMRTSLKSDALELKAIEASGRAKQALGLFKNRLLASKAAWLSEMITSEFKGLLRKQNLISRVVVTPETYNVFIEDSIGNELPMERLSAGERQILAISVLSALIRERKGRFPVVVDTPLARLDRNHRESLIHRFFAKVSHQVLVLSTDEEVEGPVYSALEKHLSREYSLNFDDAQRRSLVRLDSRQLELEDAL
ncbi:MAG: DNA sulfur modification protein DndD [Pseudomonadaceae bacterium]